MNLPLKRIQAGIVFAVFWMICTPSLSTELIRNPVWAGRFYPADRTLLKETIHTLSQKARSGKNGNGGPGTMGKQLRALILPHAGYIYSGFTAAHAGPILETFNKGKVIVMGPDHRVGFKGGAISAVTFYETPLGKIPVHTDAKMLIKRHPFFNSVPESDEAEHSVEVILPFLQFYLENFQLVPIVLGYGNTDQYKEALISIIDTDTLIVASSDLSHFLQYEEAVKKDTKTIAWILQYQIANLAKSNDSACGPIPIIVLLKIGLEKNWEPTLLHYSNSGDTAGDKQRVVGYAAIAFFESSG